MNHPSATYQAENKGYQLSIASRMGFRIPETLITNSSKHLRDVATASGRIAVKGLDTVLLRTPNRERFGYTSIKRVKDITEYDVSAAPSIFQTALINKIDYRVTVIGNAVHSAKILSSGKGVSGDWRRMKNSVVTQRCVLPKSLTNRCVSYVRKLGLSFGAIDLAFQDGDYFFLEINPTGEWAWLIHQACLPIDTSIADYLSA